MAQAINAPLNVQFQNNRQLTQQIQASINAVRFNFGGGSRSLNSLSQPLGRLTGQADEFTKSLDAANARVLAFGASVGIVNAFSNAFKSLVASTIEVEKAIKAITVVGDQFNGKTKQLSQGLFNVAKVTGQSFAEVSKAALEFSRQGLGVEQTLQRTQDALILTRLTGLDAAKSVEGLTAAVNGFTKAGLTTTQVLNKLAAVDQAFAVSSADLIEGFNRSAAVAENAGVTFDELAGIITSLQQQTSRGGAVIGNALKTIFTRLQDTSTLNQLQGLGIAVQDLEGNLLPARQILQNLAKDVEGLGQITRAGIFKDVAGTFQINQLIALVSDLGKKNSIAAKATEQAAGATNEAFVANQKLNQSLDAILNKVAVTGKQLGSLIGEIGLSDSFKSILDSINGFLEGAANLLQGDDLGGRFAKGIIKGIGAVLTGPGLGIFLAVIAKLTLDLVKFGTQSVKTFFGIGKAAREQQLIQEAITQTLLREQGILNRILSVQGGQNAQAQEFLSILNQQEQALQNIRTLAGGIAAPLIGAGYGIGPQGNVQRRGRAAGGYLPAQEAADVRRGVGGASPSSKVVAIPNFAFGGGKRGTMIANTSEYIVPNYAGGGSAIFNQDMVKTMGLPPGAKKIGAAGGFVPNFRGIKGLQGRSIKYNPSKYIEDSFLQDLNNDKAPVILAGRIFESLSNGDSFINLYENETKADIQKGAYRIAEAKLSIEAGLKDSRLGIEEEKGGKGNKLLVPLSAKVTESGQQKLEQRGIKLVKHKTLTHPLLFSKAREIIAQYKNKSNIPNKIKIASNGYVPNFANYVYDSDRLGSGKNEILQAILDSTVTKNLLVGPAGSGKSTAAAGLGTFIKSIDDVRKASSFTILSAAGLSKEGGFSTSFQNILNAVKSSGGKTTYLGTTNEELKRRRASRTASEGDLRSQAQLAGTAYAPLNQSTFIKQLKKESGNFEMMRSGKGGFTNNQLAVLGLYGENSPTGIDGSPIYTLESRGADLARNIKGEYETYVKSFVAEYSQELANKIGVTRTPKEVKKAIQQSSSISGFIFEDVLNQLAGDFDTNSISGGARADFRMTGQLRSVFKAGQEKYAEAKLNPYTSDAAQSVRDKQIALASGATAPTEITSSKVKELRERAIALGIGKGGRVGRESQAQRNSFIQEMINAGLIKSGYGTSADQTTAIKRVLGIASTGYIPNFAASALQEAIAREKSAGLSSSQIYVDQSSALKSPSNPMGLMVANTRDEPSGGFQGIARARKEGANPKLYGAARGFVPNFVPTLSGYAANLNQSSGGSNPPQEAARGFADLAGKLIIAQSAMTFLSAASAEVGGKFEQFATSLTQTIGSLVQFGFLLQGTKLGDKIAGSLKGLVNRIPGLNRIGGAAQSGSGFIGRAASNIGRLAGPAGVAIAGAYLINQVGEGIQSLFRKDLSQTFNKLNESADLVTQSMSSLAKETEKAAQKQAFSYGELTSTEILQEIFTLGQRQTVSAFGEAYTGQDMAEEDIKKVISQIVQAASARGFTGQGLRNEVGQRLSSISQEDMSLGRNVIDLTVPENVKKLNLYLRESAILGELSKKQEEFAQTQALSQQQTESTIKILNVNKSVLIALNTQYEKLKDSILRLDVNAAFEKFANKTLLDLDNNLSAGARAARELDNSLKEIDIDFNLEQSKSAAAELEKINTSVADNLRKIGGAITPEQVKSLEALQSQFVDLNISAEDFQKFVSGAKLGSIVDTESIIKARLEFERQTQEQKRQLDLRKAQARLESAQKILTEQNTLAIQRQNQAIDDQIKLLEKRNSNQDKVREATRRIEDARFERGLVGKPEASRLAAQAERATGVELRRAQEDILREFQRDLQNSITEIRIPENISPTEALGFRRRIANQAQDLSGLTKGERETPEQFAARISGQYETGVKRIIDEIAQAEKKASEAALEAAKLPGELFKLDVQEAGLSFIQLIKEGLLKLLPDQTQTAGVNANAAPAMPVELSKKAKDLQYAIASTIAFAKNNPNVNVRDTLSELTKAFANETRNTAQTAQAPVLLPPVTVAAPRPIQDSPLSNLEDKRRVIEEQRKKLLEEAAQAAQGNAKSQKELVVQAKDTTPVLTGLAAATEEAGLKADQARRSLAEMSSTLVAFNKLVTDYILGLPSELANLQFGALQATNPDDLVSKLIGQQAINETAGLTGEDRVKEIAGITALREKQYEISIAESATRRRELEYELQYLERFLVLKKEGATVEELAAERRRQIEEQRTFGRGFERGLDGVQDSIDNYRSELGQEIPRLFSQNLAQGLNDAISGAKSLKDALTDAATSFFQAITQKNIENLANIFTVGGGKAAKNIFGFASGGMIKGGSGTKDDVPAMLMGGEYVMKKSAVNKYGSSFFDALNSGKIKGFANGGGVQSGTGGFYVPGEYGTGGIRGKRELLSFATQSFTGGQYDSAGGFGMSGASVSLEPESMRLSQIGRQNNPMFERVQETKQQAFDLYLQQLKQESQYQDQLKQMEEADKQREKQLVTSIVSAVASAVVSVGAKAFATGAENAVAQAGAEAGKPLTGLSKLGAGFMGGLKNLGALVPGGAKPTFELNNFAKETRLFDAVGFNKTFPPIYSSGTFTSGSYEWSPSKGNYGRVGRAAGGMVYGGSGMRDDVPAMLTGGEFVLNNRATRKLGVQNLNRLNAGETGGEDRSGAITESLLGKLDELIQATRESSGDNVVVNVNSSESGGNNEQSMAGNEKELQRKIRQAVLDVIAQEKRLGGSLNKNN